MVELMTPDADHDHEAVILPFRRNLNDEEWLALSVVLAYCERADSPENVHHAAHVVREVLR